MSANLCTAFVIAAIIIAAVLFVRKLKANTPLYQHDRDDCHYLGRFTDDRGVADLYLNLDGARSTVIARYSSDGTGEAYGVSAYGFIGTVTAAVRRAENSGLIVEGRDFVRV